MHDFLSCFFIPLLFSLQSRYYQYPKGNLKVCIAQLLQEALIGTHSLMGESVMQSLQLFVFGPKNYELFLEDFRVDNYVVGGFGGLIRRKKEEPLSSYIGFKGVNMLFICCHLSG
ncbi:hypothetical protein Syun_000620 [Stephania yunnanensis]|uniref:LAGLIDADG homing endonuclease n=1 Tax=Stephania yunnanensis TaxID=152371 RepID=A0AAP0LF56_9MAGN